ncbi:MAG: hypothetical protein MRY83_13885 [Flavobacteriales bacterium]|nr:hypothetical protein [Flavobacteriales bacterium]
MKKHLRSTFLLVSSAFLLSSCAKTWSCECTHTSADDPQLKTAYTSDILGTRKVAEEECMSAAGIKGDYRTDCSLR